MTCLVVMLLAATGHADPQPTPTLQVLPQCKVYKLADGRQICGYVDLGDVQTLYRLDSELVMRRREVQLLDQRVAALEQAVTDLRGSLGSSTRAVVTLQERNGDLLREALAKDKALQEERVKPRWGSTAAWSAAGVLGAVLAGFVLAGALD